MQGIGNICILSVDHSNPLHNQLPSCYRSHKASYSNFNPKIGCHGNFHQHLCTPIKHMIPWANPRPQLKQHLDRFSCLGRDDRRVPYTLQWEVPSASNCPFPWGDLEPHLIHGSLGPPPPESSTQMESRSVQPFKLQGSLVSQTDRQTDHATWSVTIGHIYDSTYVVLQCSLIIV